MYLLGLHLKMSKLGGNGCPNAFIGYRYIHENRNFYTCKKGTPLLFYRTSHSRSIFLGHFGFFMYFIQHCFICRPSGFAVSEDAGIESRTVATLALAVRRSNHSPRSYPNSARSHLHSARSHPPSAISHPHLARSHPHSASSPSTLG
jgi:hypothetical protein